MALQKLNTLGIIETRVGEGSFVCSFSLRPALSAPSVFYEGEDKYHDVKQLRNLLEYECMRLAVYSASDAEKKNSKARWSTIPSWSTSTMATSITMISWNSLWMPTSIFTIKS